MLRNRKGKVTILAPDKGRLGSGIYHIKLMTQESNVTLFMPLRIPISVQLKILLLSRRTKRAPRNFGA